MVEKLSEFNKAENERLLSVVIWKRSLGYAEIVVNNWIQFSVSVAEIDLKYGWTLNIENKKKTSVRFFLHKLWVGKKICDNPTASSNYIWMSKEALNFANLSDLNSWNESIYSSVPDKSTAEEKKSKINTGKF